MNRTARVTSIEAVRAFKAALEKYQKALSDSLSSLSTETNRAVEWLEADRMAYWPNEVRDSSDELAEAKNALARKELSIGSDEKRSAYEEKKAVQKAKERQRYCQQRYNNTKHWLRIVGHDVDEFQGLLGSIGHFSESDLPKAIAKLEQLASALEKYASQTSPPDKKE